jgi:hypothetical protein
MEKNMSDLSNMRFRGFAVLGGASLLTALSHLALPPTTPTAAGTSFHLVSPPSACFHHLLLRIPSRHYVRIKALRLARKIR